MADGASLEVVLFIGGGRDQSEGLMVGGEVSVELTGGVGVKRCEGAGVEEAGEAALASKSRDRVGKESCVCQLLHASRMLVIEQSDNDNAWVRHSHQIDLTIGPSNVLQWQKPTAKMIHLATANSTQSWYCLYLSLHMLHSMLLLSYSPETYSRPCRFFDQVFRSAILHHRNLASN